MIVPDEEPYDEKRYLSDALRAFWHKVYSEKRSYWPEYTGINPSIWEEVRPIVTALLIFAIIVVGVMIVAARSDQYQIVPTKPTELPAFTTAP